MLKNTYLEREAMQAVLALVYLLFINGEEGEGEAGRFGQKMEIIDGKVKNIYFEYIHIYVYIRF